MADNPDAMVAAITPDNLHHENVVKFEPREIGAGYRFDADEILEQAKGRGFLNVLIIAEQDDGELWVSSAANAGEAMILMEKAKHRVCFGE
jgi:hypothetical protein